MNVAIVCDTHQSVGVIEGNLPRMVDRPERFDISIIGQLRTGTGKREVTIVDLSEHGCRIFDRMGYLKHNLAVTIRIGPVGPIDATVRWQEQPYAGIRFDNPLHPAVLEHIRSHFDLRSFGRGNIDEAPE